MTAVAGVDGVPPGGDALRARIRRNMEAFAAAPCIDPAPRRAAVALAVLDIDAEPCVIVVKRVARGRNPGQWALPGGRLEPGETAIDGALREAREEVALEGAEPVGVLDDFVTQSGFAITPVVVLGPGRTTLRRNPDEVHSLHPVPLARLLDDALPRWAPGRPAPLLQMPLRHDMVIHAPTGAILWQFREVALLGRHTRVAGVAEPAFTRH